MRQFSIKPVSGAISFPFNCLHRSLILVYALKGPLIARFVPDTEPVILPSRFYLGTLLVPGSYQLELPATDSSYLYVQIRYRYLRFLSKKNKALRPLCRAFEESPSQPIYFQMAYIDQEVLKLFSRIKALGLSDNHLPIAIKHYLVDLLQHYGQQLLRSDPIAYLRSEEKVLLLMQHLQLHYTAHGIEKLDTLKAQFYLSRSTLTRVFEDMYGCSIGYMVTYLRMHQAKRHIRDGLTIKKSAQLVGFENEFAFSRAYHSFFGHSPRQKD
ncbi:AraC-type DNA-binding protein [bacterium A37T11]|nr:AraC-type DNA-binding protein [bacterium A37T11]